MKVTISKEKLESLYGENSAKEVARILGVTKPTIIQLLRELGIPVRPQGAPRKIIIKGS